MMHRGVVRAAQRHVAFGRAVMHDEIVDPRAEHAGVTIAFERFLAPAFEAFPREALPAIATRAAAIAEDRAAAGTPERGLREEKHENEDNAIDR